MVWVNPWHMRCNSLQTVKSFAVDTTEWREHAMIEPLMALCTSSKMQPIRDLISKVASTNTTVLLRGESGTGKEVLARAIHKASPRAGKQFLKVNCAALPGELLESELFGHEKGAFTGAYRQTLGKFEAADQGTLLLDEIGEMPLRLQAKLLHVLQDGEFSRVGGEKTIGTDVRLIASTNRDLENAVKRVVVLGTPRTVHQDIAASFGSPPPAMATAPVTCDYQARTDDQSQGHRAPGCSRCRAHGDQRSPRPRALESHQGGPPPSDQLQGAALQNRSVRAHHARREARHRGGTGVARRGCRLSW